MVNLGESHGLEAAQKYYEIADQVWKEKHEELKQANAELRKANELVRKGNQSVTRLLGSLEMASKQQQQAKALLQKVERHLEVVETDHHEEPPRRERRRRNAEEAKLEDRSQDIRPTKRQRGVPEANATKNSPSNNEEGVANRPRAKGNASFMTPATGTRKKKSSKKWYFGYLWTEHLEPNGWTMSRAKRKPLADYYYVKPGKSCETGVEGKDYFASDYDVLDYCAQHGDYPSSSSSDADESSSPEEECSPEVYRAARDVEMAEGESPEEELSVDEERTKIHVHEDEQTNKDVSYQTPSDQKTVPQDPAKPLLKDQSCSPAENGEMDIYLWINLWPKLEKCGWKCMKSRNKLQDWWWVRPGHKPVTEGKDYFASEEFVIAYCKDMDEDDKIDNNRMVASEGEQSPRKPLAVRNQQAPKPSDSSADRPRPKRTAVEGAENRVSTSNDKFKRQKDKKTKSQKKSHVKAN
jgi:hypothetical protein